MLVISPLRAQENGNTNDTFEVRLDVNDEDGVLYGSNSIQAFVEMLNRQVEDVSAKVEWKILTDNFIPLFDATIVEKVEKQGRLASYCPHYRFTGPGFYRIEARISVSSGEIFEKQFNIGINPEKISAPVDAQPDFESFWQKTLGKVNEVKHEYQLIPIERDQNSKTNLFRVEIKSIDGITLRGWLELPKKPGLYPALFRVPGYTENLEPVDKYDDLIIFSFNTRNHGESDNIGERSYDMWVRGLEQPEGFFYHELIMDCLQGLDFLCSREDVDKNRIAVWGGSQGGGLSFAMAALDRRISLCIADIPFLCEFPRYFESSHWTEIDAWFVKNPDQTWQSMFKTLSYFDMKNMADKITCPVYLGIGLQDDVCPPATSFVAFNKVQSQKEYNIYKYEYHGQPDSHYEGRFLKIRELFQMDK
jgi:cephalosporin-C deacetylase-like acetyl esterase